MTQILVNGVRTPDGTEIFSRHQHDCVQHVDANGETYMVDGGTSYVHRTANLIPAESLDQVMTDDHDHNRQHMHWGTRGPGGKESLTWVTLMSMSTDHIEAILETQPQIKGKFSEELFKAELEYRNAIQG